MNKRDLLLFALGASRPFGDKVAAALGCELAAHEERGFEDGEHKARPLVNVRGRDVFVIHSLYGDDAESPNDKLVRLLFFIGALKDASAARVTAVLPYLAYARKDRKTKSRDPVSTKYMAEILESVGTDRVLAFDVHNLQAFQNAFRIPADHLEAKGLFAAHFAALARNAPLAVMSPDAGGFKRAEAFRQKLAQVCGGEVALVFMEKTRSAGVVAGAAVVGDVAGTTVIVLDDLISTGTTMARAAAAARAEGAKAVFAAATHGLFVSPAETVVADPALDGMVITDSVPPFRLSRALAARRLVVLPAAPLFAEAIARIHGGGSLIDLLGE